MINRKKKNFTKYIWIPILFIIIIVVFLFFKYHTSSKTEEYNNVQEIGLIMGSIEKECDIIYDNIIYKYDKNNQDDEKEYNEEFDYLITTIESSSKQLKEIFDKNGCVELYNDKYINGYYGLNDLKDSTAKYKIEYWNGIETPDNLQNNICGVARSIRRNMVIEECVR